MTEEAANQFRAVQVSSDNRMPHSSQAAARPHAAFSLKHTGARAEPKHLLGFMHLERVKINVQSPHFTHVLSTAMQRPPLQGHTLTLSTNYFLHPAQLSLGHTKCSCPQH